MGSKNNGKQMTVGIGSGLTILMKMERDKEGMRVVEEVGKNKSTEKDESTSDTRQDLDVYHFTQVTKVALLLSPFF